MATTFDMPTASYPPSELIPGYPKFAGRMELIPEIAIFRRFGALNAQNLLYLQAQLVSLEQELRAREKEDSVSGHVNYAFDWFWLQRSAKGGHCTQWDLVKKTRKTLKEYNRTLVEQSIILGLQKPKTFDINDIQAYMSSSEMGKSLIGEDGFIWGTIKNRKGYAPDLVALKARHNEDFFSTWVTEKLTAFLLQIGIDRLKKPSTVSGLRGFHDSSLLQLTFLITSLLASLLPIASISILYCVNSMSARLGIIAAFNIVLSLCLSAFTTANRSEAFAITAAFAAVQVVFVGSTNSIRDS